MLDIKRIATYIVLYIIVSLASYFFGKFDLFGAFLLGALFSYIFTDRVLKGMEDLFALKRQK